MHRAEATTDRGLLVLYDGQCMLCSGWVTFLRKHDPKGIFRFASIQSDQGQAILAEHGLASDTFDSMVTVANGRAFIKSSAGLLCLRHLPFPWPLLGITSVVPRPLRDWIYDRVAKRRYQWFGHQKTVSYTHPKNLSTTEEQDHE